MSKYITPTYTGIRFDLLEPTIDMICIEDIAHHLSIENRFNGATKFAYSVGYHSLLCCHKANLDIKLELLLHDAHEAYYKDLTHYLKELLNTNNEEYIGLYNGLTNNLDDLLCELFNVDFKNNSSRIESIDKRMATTEWNLLIDQKAHGQEIQAYDPYKDIDIMRLSPENVEKLFLTEFDKWRRDK